MEDNISNNAFFMTAVANLPAGNFWERSASHANSNSFGTLPIVFNNLASLGTAYSLQKLKGGDSDATTV